jgi:integral membrane sensor domain MASE1
LLLSPKSRTGLVGFAVFLGCFAGAAAGDLLTFPGVGTAVLYPPYAVLTAALVWTAPREWWVYLLACTAGSLAPHIIAGAPPSFALLTEIANYARALIAAVAIREFCVTRRWRGSLRGMAIFLMFAVVVAPLVAALIGAGLVAWYNGAGVTGRRHGHGCFRDALTALTLLPVLIGPYVCIAGTGESHEAAALSVSVLAVSALVHFSSSPAFTQSPAALCVVATSVVGGRALRRARHGTVAPLSVTVLAIVGTEHGLGHSSPAHRATGWCTCRRFCS